MKGFATPTDPACKDRLAPVDWRDMAAASSAALAALAIYLATMPPALSGEDCGELVAAAYTLGIPHPTGYPLWCLLAKAVMLAVPLGPVTWRAALLSALLAAGTVFLVTLLVARMTRNRIAAAGAGLALAFSFEFWEQSVIPEVYTLNAFLVIACVFLVLQWEKTSRLRHLCLTGLVYGLGLCNHSAAYLLAPIFLAYVFWDEHGLWQRPRDVGLMVLACLVGFSVYLYLPIRSLADPPMDWGNPETLSNFWDVFTRKQYQFLLTENPRSAGRFFRQLGIFAGLYGRQFTPWMAWLPVVGVAGLFARKRSWGLLIMTLFVVASITAIIIPNFDFTFKSIWLNTTYWVHAYALAAILLGVGIDWLARRSSVPALRTAISGVLAAAAALSPLLVHYHANDKSNFWFSSDYADNVLETLDADALYFGDSDHSLFSLIHHQIVLGKRPDVTIANPYGYILPSLYEDMPAELTRDMPKIPTNEDDQTIIAWILAHTERPVYFTWKPSRRALAGRQVVNAGLLYRLDDGTPVDEDAIWESYTWHTLDAADARGDWTAGLILYDYHMARARYLFGEGDKDAALAELDEALSVADPIPMRLNDCGSLCAENGLWTKAEQFYVAALRHDPDFGMARLNLGKVVARQGRLDEALREFDAVPEDAEQWREAQLLAARCLTRLGRPEKAEERLRP